MTRKRDLVFAALASDDEAFVTAQDLHARLRADGMRVGLTTVYRTLQHLADAGEVDALQAAGGQTAYRRCAQHRHHHHLVCESCGRTVEVSGPAVERWAAGVAEAHGFTNVRHNVEVFGLCPACRPMQSP